MIVDDEHVEGSFSLDIPKNSCKYTTLLLIERFCSINRIDTYVARLRPGNNDLSNVDVKNAHLVFV